MESLKLLDEITLPDSRNLAFALVDHHGNQRPIDLEYRHRVASAITLNSSVPEAIRDHFAQALNLHVYSWFHYQFHVTSEFMSMVTVEYALREKFKPESRVTFKQLIERAVREGLIQDEGFAIARGEPVSDKRYVEMLVNVLPGIRNDYAHGTYMLHNQSITSLQIAADFINQLFPHESG